MCGVRGLALPENRQTIFVVFSVPFSLLSFLSLRAPLCVSSLPLAAALRPPPCPTRPHTHTHTSVFVALAVPKTALLRSLTPAPPLRSAARRRYIERDFSSVLKRYVRQAALNAKLS